MHRSNFEELLKHNETYRNPFAINSIHWWFLISNSNVSGRCADGAAAQRRNSRRTCSSPMILNAVCELPEERNTDANDSSLWIIN